MLHPYFYSFFKNKMTQENQFRQTNCRKKGSKTLIFLVLWRRPSQGIQEQIMCWHIARSVRVWTKEAMLPCPMVQWLPHLSELCGNLARAVFIIFCSVRTGCQRPGQQVLPVNSEHDAWVTEPTNLSSPSLTEVMQKYLPIGELYKRVCVFSHFSHLKNRFGDRSGNRKEVLKYWKRNAALHGCRPNSPTAAAVCASKCNNM